MNGGYLESSAFEAGGHTWRIRCYHNGSCNENAGFISVFLRRVTADAAADAVDKGSVVQAELEFALVHHRGTLRASSTVRMFNRRLADFSENVSMGYPRFVGVEDLKRSRFLKDDSFAVRCKVTILQVQEWAVKGDPRPRRTVFARFFSCIRG
ncbi:hypothetical protein D1007_58491 [Hordeum vulgare]|nr:hypothetical protein D1007_58491 [Hordeum vulgare]